MTGGVFGVAAAGGSSPGSGVCAWHSGGDIWGLREGEHGNVRSWDWRSEYHHDSCATKPHK